MGFRVAETLRKALSTRPIHYSGPTAGTVPPVLGRVL